MDLCVIHANAHHAELFLDTISCFAVKIHCTHPCKQLYMLTMPYQHAGGCDGVQNVLFCRMSLTVSVGEGFKLNLIIQPQTGLYDVIFFLQIDILIFI